MVNGYISARIVLVASVDIVLIWGKWHGYGGDGGGYSQWRQWRDMVEIMEMLETETVVDVRNIIHINVNGVIIGKVVTE